MCNKLRACLRVALLMMVVFAFLTVGAAAETAERGDLSKRFGNIETIEYNGCTYRIRNRLTIALVMGTVGDGEDGTGADYAELMYLLVIDDDQRIYTPIQIPSSAWVNWQGSELWPETGEVQLRAMYSMVEDGNDGCRLILQKLDEILGGELIGCYAALDMDRLTLIDGIEPSEVYVEQEYKDRMHAIKASAEQSSTDEINEMFNVLSGYIVTDMKSGALMKIVDKVDRYDGQPTIVLPVIEEILEDGQTRVRIDESAVLPVVLSAFYEEYAAW